MVPSPAMHHVRVENFCRDEAGPGYSRSAFSTIARSMSTLANGIATWPKAADASTGKPYIPRLLLYVHHLRLCCNALNILAEDDILAHFHVFFRTDMASPSLVYFFARRALESLLPNTLGIKSKTAAHAPRESLGARSYGFMGSGGLPTVQKLLGQEVQPLPACNSGYNSGAVHCYLQLKAAYGEVWQQEAVDKLGFRNCEFFDYGNFENMCCEKRKKDDYVAKAALQRSLSVYKTHPHFVPLLPFADI